MILKTNQVAKRACTAGSRAKAAVRVAPVRAAAVEAPAKQGPIIMDGQVLHSISAVSKSFLISPVLCADCMRQVPPFSTFLCVCGGGGLLCPPSPAPLPADQLPCRQGTAAKIGT